jgi:GNAT superfamily N-acetyltransferase
LTIERARLEDAEALVRVQVAAFHDDARLYPGVALGGPPGYDSVATMLLKIDKDESYKLVYEGEIVGGLVVYDYGEGHFHLDVIFVDPAYQGHGFGTQAIQFIERTYPATKWTLDTPTYALRNQHFYEKFGYLRMGEADLGDVRLIAYEKRL